MVEYQGIELSEKVRLNIEISSVSIKLQYAYTRMGTYNAILKRIGD